MPCEVLEFVYVGIYIIRSSSSNVQTNFYITVDSVNEPEDQRSDTLIKSLSDRRDEWFPKVKHSRSSKTDENSKTPTNFLCAILSLGFYRIWKQIYVVRTCFQFVKNGQTYNAQRLHEIHNIIKKNKSINMFDNF